MTKTPRTDEQLKLEAFFDGIGIVETVEVEFAQQLETELADKDQQLAGARAEIERLNKNLRLLLCETHFDKCEVGLFNSKNPDDEPCLICLMGAAERGE